MTRSKAIGLLALSVSLTFGTAVRATDILVPSGSIWRYDDTGTDLGDTWRDIAYDDAAWAENPAQLGYGDGDEATVLSYGPDPNNKYPTYYFRHEFTVFDAGVYASLTLQVLRDDGCVVYLNGTEVTRSNMPAGTISYSTFASGVVGGDAESTFQSFALDVNDLVDGTNVLAVELHQANASSSDISFDLTLEADVPKPSVTLESPANGVTVNTTDVTLTCSATDAVGLQSATLYVGNEPGTAVFSGPAETEDAHLSAADPDSNFGAALALNVDGENPHSHGVIQFPYVFGNLEGQVPLGSTIVSATLEVNCTNFGAIMQVWRLLEGWNENDVTWNYPWSGPGAEGLYSRDTSVVLSADCTATGLRTIDITDFVQRWSDGALNRGILLTDTGTDGVDFDSSESANPPVLTVVFQPDFQPVGDPEPLSGTSDTATFDVTLGDQQSHIWNCLVTNSAGEQSFAAASFTLTVDSNIPDEPSLVGPGDGAVSVDTSPTLEVSVNDPNLDAMDVTFYGRGMSSTAEFTVVALPDTQFYSESFPQVFDAQTQWIVDSQASQNIVFVTHEGDVVQTWDDTAQWDNANASMSLLDGVVPYGIAPGNHDTPTTYFNQYFPYTRFDSQLWYGGHYGDTNDNNYQLFSAEGQDFLVLHLEFCPRPEVRTWADGILKSYPDRKAIITTHGYLDASGNRFVGTCGDTSFIWDEIVVPNPNVWFVLCGHIHDEHYRVDIANGHEVHQLLADYQDRDNFGGNGWLRTLRFVPGDNAVYVQTYSPWLNQFKTGSSSEFILDLPMNEFSIIGTATAVPSGSIAAVSWPDLDENTEFEWYAVATDTTGKSSASPLWSFTTGAGDVTPPDISDVAAGVQDRTATITWTTDEAADSTVDYGLDTSYGSQVTDATLVLSHSVELIGLQPSKTYNYRVTSTDAAGNPASSANYTFTTLADTTAPAAPLNLVASAGDELASLDWDDNAEVDFATYSVHRSTTDGGPYTTVATGLVSSSYDDTGLANDTTYYWVVTALDTTDNESALSNQASATPLDMTPPAPPTGLAANSGDRSTVLDWSDNGEPDLATYSVYRSTSAGGPYSPVASGVAASTYTDTGLTNGTTYYWVVTATDTSDNESTYSGEASATPSDITPPAAPQNLAATASDGQASLDWDDNSESDLASYSVYRSTTQGSGYTLVTAGLGSSDYVDTGLTNGTTYYWVVTASDTSANESANSAEASATPTDLTPPAAPTGLVATADDGQVSLDWADNGEGDLASYSVYRSTTQGSGYALLAADLGPSDYVDAGLTNGTTYYYVVTAVDAIGNESAFSAEASATPQDMTPPAAPQGLQAVAGDGTVDLSWIANGESDLAGYDVYRGTSSGSHPDKLNAALLVAATFSDTTAVNGTTYYYVVTAVDTIGNESDDSNEASATPQDATAPAAPQNLQATGGMGQVALDWNDNAEGDLAGYNVYRSLISGSDYAQVNGSLVTTSHWVDSGLSAGVTYYWVVTAVDLSGNESAASTEASAAPLSRVVAIGEPVVTVGTILSGAYTDTHTDDGATQAWEEGGVSGGRRGLDGYYAMDVGLASADITALDLTLGAWFDDADGNLVDAPQVFARNFATADWDDLSISITATADGTTYTASLDPSTHVSGANETWIRFLDGSRVKREAKEKLYIDEIALDVSGQGDPPPAAPTGLAAIAGDSVVSLDWDDNSDPDLAGYNVYRSTTSGSGYSLVNGGLVMTSDFVDSTVANGTTYYWIVRAVDTMGGESDDSNEATATPADSTPPAAPAGLVANAGDSAVDLAWTANTEPDLAGYDVYRGTSPGSHATKVNASLVSPSPSPSYSDSTATNGTTYYYVVTAVDTSGNPSGDSNEASATPQNGPPLAPTNLVATPGDGQASLVWSANGEPDIAGYDVYRSQTSGGPYSLVNTAALVTTNAYTDTGLTNGTTYYWVVTAVDSGDLESGNSNEAAATPTASGDALHVAAIDMNTTRKGPNWEAQATVTIRDQTDALVTEASIVGDWLYTPAGGTQEVLQSGATGTTSGEGTLVLKSPKKRAGSGDVFTFRVTDVSKAGFGYDDAANVETEDSIAVP